MTTIVLRDMFLEMLWATEKYVVHVEMFPIASGCAVVGFPLCLIGHFCNFTIVTTKVGGEVQEMACPPCVVVYSSASACRGDLAGGARVP